MDDVNYLRFISASHRQTGKTTALAKACEAINGIFIVASESQKKQLKKDFPNLDIRVFGTNTLIGTRSPIIIDHFAYEIIINRVYDKLQGAEGVINIIKDAVNNY